MASKTLTLNKLVSSDFSENSSWVLNKGGGGDTDVGYFVFNSLGVSSAKITNVSFKINAIETGGNNLFAENIYLNFEFGRYVGSTFTKSSAFSFGQQGVKESQNKVSITATASGNATLNGDNLCIKLTITPQSNSIGSKIIMSGFTLAVTYEVPTYTATFLNYDGTELQKVTVQSGSTPSYSGATPTRPKDAQYTYTFSGWDKPLNAITSDTTYTAQFTASLREFLVFVTCSPDLNSGEIATVTGGGTYKYGDTVILHATAPEYHRLGGWRSIDVFGTHNVVNINPLEFTINDEIANAVDKDIGLVCFIEHTGFLVRVNMLPDRNAGVIGYGQFATDVNGDTVYISEGVVSEQGLNVTYPLKDKRALEARANEGYKFIGWSDGVTANPRTLSLTGDATYTAIFEKNGINNIYRGVKAQAVFKGTEGAGEIAVYKGNSKVFE